MGLNLLGLGFSFGAKDNGLAGKQREVASGFASIANEVQRMGSKTDRLIGLSKLSTFIQSISLARLNDIAGGLDQLANGGQNLTTSLEGTIVTSSKTAKALAVNYGVAGKEISRFTSKSVGMSVALNIGADKAAEATYQHTLAVKELRAVGLKTATDLAKFSEVTGVSADQIVQTLRQAGKQFNFTDSELQNLAGSFVNTGQATGDVAGSLKEMPKVMELISRRAAVMGRKLSSKEMASFAAQTANVTAAFYAMGASTEEARESALAISTKMVESGETFADMFAGTKNELHEFALSIGIGTGDINNAFAAMNQGPAEFMAGLAEMVVKSKKSGRFTAESMNLLRGHLSKTFGEKQSALMTQMLDKVDDASIKVMKSAQQATADLGKLAKQGFSDGRTLAERFDLQKDVFIMGFRSIGRSAAEDFVKETGKQFKIFNKQMNSLVKKGGTMGKLVEKFSELHQIGALALLPEALRPMGAVFGTVVKEASPLIGVLGSLGFRLNMLFSPFTLLLTAAAALGAWFAKLRLEGKSTGQAISIMGSKIMAGAKKLWKAIKNVVGQLIEYLKTVDWEAVFTRVFTVMMDILQGIGSLLAKVPWGKIALGVGKALVKAFDIIVSSLGKAVSFLFSKMLELFEYTASEGFRNKLMSIAKKVSDGLKHVLNKLFDLVEGALDYLGRIDLGKAVENVLRTAVNIAKAVVHVALSAIEVLFRRLPSILIKAVKLAIKALIEIPKAIGRVLNDLGPWAQQTMKRLATAVLNGLWAILRALPGLVVKAFKAIPAIIASFGSMMKGAVNMVVRAIIGIFEGIEDWLVEKFPSAAGVIHTIFDGIKAAIRAVGAVWKFTIDAIITAFRVLWKVIETIAKAIWWAIDTFIITPLKFIANIIKTVVIAAWEGLKAAVQAVWDVIGPVITKIGEGIAWVGDKLGWVAGKAIGAAKAVGGFLSDVGGGIKDFFVGGPSLLELYTKKSAKVIKKELSDVQVTVDKLMKINADLMATYHQVMSSQIVQSQQKIVNNTIKTEQEKYAALGVLQSQFAKETSAVLAKIPESMKHSATTAQQELHRAFYEQLKEITTNEKLTNEQRKQAMIDLDAWRAGKLKEFTAIVNQQTMEMQASGGAAASSMETAFTNLIDSVRGKADEAALRSNAAVDSMQRELSVSAEEALENITDIAKIDPKKFAADLKVIKAVYIDFAKTAQEQSKVMLESAGKAFDEFNVRAIDNWKKQKDNVTLMVLNADDIKRLTEQVTLTVNQAFTALTGVISTSLEEAVQKAFVNAFKKVIVETKVFAKDEAKAFSDLADAIVKKFGDSWVKILGFTTTALDAIEKDTSRAVTNLKRIEAAMRSAQSTKVDIAGATVKQEVKMTTGKSELDNIFQATHHPEWYEQDFKAKVSEILMTLNAVLAALTTSTRGGQTTQGPSSRSAARQIQSGIGMGDPYARTGGIK